MFFFFKDPTLHISNNKLRIYLISYEYFLIAPTYDYVRNPNFEAYHIIYENAYQFCSETGTSCEKSHLGR